MRKIRLFLSIIYIMVILFSERLKQLRIDAKLKQSDIAKALNTTQRRISYFEMGKVEPDLITLCMLAEYFSVSTDFLLGYKDY